MRACFFLAWLVVAGGVTQSISVHSETTCSPTAWQYSLTLLVPACTAVACKAGYVGTLPTALSVSCDGPEEPRPTGRQVEVAVFEDEACTLWMLTFLAEPGVCVDTRRNPYRGTTFRASFGSVRAACLSDGSVLITTFVDAQCRNATPTQYPQLMSGCNRGQDALGYGSNSVRASCAGASGGSGGGNLSFDLGGHGVRAWPLDRRCLTFF